MVRKLLILFVIETALVILVSNCRFSSCDDVGPSPDKYKLKDYRFYVKRLTSLKYVNSDSCIVSKDSLIDISGPVNYKLLVFSFNFIMEEFFSETVKFPNALYACSPAPPTSADIIDSIVVISNKDYDSLHPKGTNLADIIRCISIAYKYSSKFCGTLKEFYEKGSEPPEKLDLLLMKPPEKEDYYKFTIKYYQKGVDIDYFEVATDSIYIKK